MSIESYIEAMPKVEPYVQFEGAIDKKILLLFADQNDIASQQKGFQKWLDLLDEMDYSMLHEVARTTAGWVMYAEDVARAVYQLGVTLHKQNIRYAEVSVDPTVFMSQLSLDQLLSALLNGRDKVLRGWNVRLSFVMTVPRDNPRSADDIARWAVGATARKGHVEALGLSGKQDAQPIGQFKRAFAMAKKRDLERVGMVEDFLQNDHPDELLEELEPSRLIDAWGLIDHSDLMTAFDENDIPVVVTMAKNVRLQQIASYSDFPLRKLFDENVRLMIATEMPTLYDTSLNEQYLMAVQEAGLSIQELQEIALNAVRYSYLPETEKEAMLIEFQEEYARLNEEHFAIED